VHHYSNKLMFMAATAAMYVAVLYGSEASLAILVPGGPWRLANISSLTPALAAFAPDPRPAEPKQPPASQSATSVLPNGASCPAVSALVAPPSVEAAIGKDDAPLPKDASPHPQSSGVLGTGGSCPPLRADAGKSAVTPLPGVAASLANQAEAARNPRP